MKGALAVGWLGAVLLCSASRPAAADTVPDSTFISTGTYSDCPLSSPCTFTETVDGPASFAVGPCAFPISNCDGVSVVSTATTAFSGKVIGLSTQGSGTATVSVTEYYEAIGPANEVTSVPLLLSAVFSASANGSSAIAVAEVNGLPANAQGANTIGACYGSGSDGCGGGNVPTVILTNLAASVAPNEIGSVQFVAQGTASSGSFTAYFDPQLEIDPTWLSTHPGFSLEISPDLATPLPGAVWLLLSGLAGLGALRRKRPAQRQLDS
jgi:hypothetical protein